MKEVGGEARPSGKVTVVDRFDPSGRNWAAAGGMEELHKFGLGGRVICAVGVMGLEAWYRMDTVVGVLCNLACVVGLMR